MERMWCLSPTRLRVRLRVRTSHLEHIRVSVSAIMLVAACTDSPLLPTSWGRKSAIIVARVTSCMDLAAVVAMRRLPVAWTPLMPKDIASFRDTPRLAIANTPAIGLCVLEHQLRGCILQLIMVAIESHPRGLILMS